MMIIYLGLKGFEERINHNQSIEDLHTAGGRPELEQALN